MVNYTYRRTVNNTLNNSYGQRYSSNGSSNFVEQNNSIIKNDKHTLRLEANYDINPKNYLQIVPTFTFAESTNNVTNNSTLINNYIIGLQHQVFNAINTSANSTPAVGISTLYMHVFDKPRRIFSVQYNTNLSSISETGTKNISYKYYADSTLNSFVNDSASNILISRHSRNTISNVLSSYVEPIGKHTQIEVIGQFKNSSYKNTATSDSILVTGQLKRLAQLDNIYNYSFTESRYSAAFRYLGSKYDLSIGILGIPSHLQGSKINNSFDGSNILTNVNYFRLIPIFRTSYSWSNVERFTLAYNGRYTEPQFQQLQPFVDRSDPNNIVVGNPNLKPTFTNSLNAVYNRYFPNSKFNLSFELNYSAIQDQITNNIIQTNQVITNNGISTTKTINQITFQNVDHTNSLLSRYNVSKKVAGSVLNISLNGSLQYNFSNALSNNELYHNTIWRSEEKLYFKISPNDNLEINPSVSYSLSRSFTSLVNALPVTLKTTILSIDGRGYFNHAFQVNYYISKNYITGFGKLGNPSPFIVNAGFEKSFLKQKKITLTFNIYDLLHENNFVQQVITPQATTNTLTNTLGRYFLLGVKLNVQSWHGTPKRNGQPLKRRGDGSFIY